METLVAVSHHRNHNHQCCGRNCGHISGKFGSFGSTSSVGLEGVNCRAFQSGSGLLPTPMKFYSPTTPVNKKAYSASPKTPSATANQTHKTSKRMVKNSTTPIPIKMNFETKKRGLSFSERWAGPAYSNSPPPSSLPIPKFPLRPKRTVSLELPSSTTKIDLHPIAKSAPASPTRDSWASPGDLFESADSATKSLRRILNLDIDDE